MDLLLTGLRWQNENQKHEGDIRSRGGVISEISSGLIPNKREKVLAFDNHFIYPGLINGHDHLEMNLYPRMPASQASRDKPPYGNYTEWGNDIYKPGESPIKEVEKVSLADRLLWGGIKNLISGATTVVHHNPWKRILSSENFPVKVLKEYAWAHSLAFGKDILKSFPKKADVPFVIHAAEGIDELAFTEIAQLNALGLLQNNTVLIHAVALAEHDINSIVKSGASIVSCPASNFFLFNRTIDIKKLTPIIKIALGSDSTLTGSPTLLSEMQFAFQAGLASPEEIFNLVTVTPAKIFNLPAPRVTLGSAADLFILPTGHENYFENLVHSTSPQIELVIVQGEPRFGGESVASKLGFKTYFAHVYGIRKWFYCDVANLKRRIVKITGDTVEANPLWQMIS